MDNIQTKRASVDYSAESKPNNSSFRGILNGFAGETTAHGVPRIIDRKKIISKIFWTVVVVLASMVFAGQTYKIGKNYHASHTKINLVSTQFVAFPAVTVCNLNKMKRTLLAKSDRWASIASLEREPSPQIYHETEVNDTTNKEDDYDWYYDSMQDDDDKADSLPPIPTRQELREMGYKAEDIILECRFNKRKCDHTDFKTTQNKQYGNCFTFNGQDSSERVTKAGSDFGLHLTLFLDEDEYVGTLTEDIGVRLISHPRNILPNPEDDGLSLPPGFSTSIGIRQVEIKRLPHPHGDCIEEEHANYLMPAHYNYSIISCQKKCFLDNLVSKCNCVTDVYDDYEGIPYCNRTERICRQAVEKSYYLEKLGCHCPSPCREFVYNTKTTSSRWPGSKYFNVLLEELYQRGKKRVWDKLPDIHSARENLVKVDIYYEELNYELVEQVPANSVESVLGTVGGLLGLYIGFSLITVVEILIFIYDVIVFLIKKMFCS